MYLLSGPKTWEDVPSNTDLFGLLRDPPQGVNERLEVIQGSLTVLQSLSLGGVVTLFDGLYVCIYLFMKKKGYQRNKFE